jgi:Domain of unknown function (DUF4153)
MIMVLGIGTFPQMVTIAPHLEDWLTTINEGIVTTAEELSRTETTADWPARTLGLAIAGAAVGCCAGWLVKDGAATLSAAGRWAITVFLLTAGIATALLVERRRLASSFGFASLAGALAASAMYFSIASAADPGRGPDGGPRQFACALIAIGLAIPLFASWRQHAAPRLSRPTTWPYPYVHERAWASAMLWCAGWAFVLVTILLVVLLANLFALIGLTGFDKLLESIWFMPTVAGAAFGAAVGMLRDREQVLGVLKVLVHRVLSAVTVPVALGLAAFVIALFFTGLTPLWEATKSTTPLLLVAAIIAILLVNVTIGDQREHESRNRILRIGATALAVTVLPLSIIALVSVYKRIAQHGLTPDRIWASIFVLVICGYALTYLFAVLRRRSAWPSALRTANLGLASAVCVIATVLALPLFDFGSWSVRNQMTRLTSGKISADDFDWAAMAVDFGPAGRTQLERLGREAADKEVRALATAALKNKNRWEARAAVETQQQLRSLREKLVVIPAPIAIPQALQDAMSNVGQCAGKRICHLYYIDGSNKAALIRKACDGCGVETTIYTRSGASWNILLPDLDENAAQATTAIEDALATNNVEIRDVTRRQVFVGDAAIGPVFE